MLIFDARRENFYDADTNLCIVWRPRQGGNFRFEFSNVNEAHRAMRNFSILCNFYEDCIKELEAELLAAQKK